MDFEAKRSTHFVPRSYLAQFTEELTTRGTLWVTDIHSGFQYRQSVSNVCVERDLYSLQYVRKQNILENALAQADGDVKGLLDSIASSRQIAPGEDSVRLAWFVGLLALRAPEAFGRFRSATEQSLELSKGTPARTFAEAVLGLSDLGDEPLIADRREIDSALRAFQDYSTGLIRDCSTIAPFLTSCKTCLLLSREPAELVSSDRPVVWLAEKLPMPLARLTNVKSPVYAITVARNMGVLAFLEGDSTTLAADDDAVAAFNTLVWGGAVRYLLSASADFCLLDSQSQRRNVRDLIPARS